MMRLNGKRLSGWRFLLLLVLVLMLAACSGGGDGGSDDNENPGGDNDGIEASVETDGWDIQLDRYGNGDYETVHVTSDPDKDDSDGDGLSDAVEKNESLTNPMAADSDGDGLSDYDEIYVYASNPASVDSDGDSTGEDPENPLSSNPLLHDGSEVTVYHSSPTMADTDGDELSDYYEIVESGIFNPAVADLPEVDIEIDPDSLPKVSLEGSHTTTENWGTEISMTDTLEQSVTYSKSATSSTEIAHNASVSVGSELAYSLGLKEEGLSYKLSGELGYSFNHATTNEVSWGSDKATTAQQQYQEIISQSESEELTVTGGTITTGLTVTNTGNIAFELTDLNLSVRVCGSAGRFTEVMALSQPDGFASVTLSPLNPETGALLFEGTSTDVDLMTSLLRDPGALLFEMGSFSLLDEYGRDYAYMEQGVAAKTAAVFIDYGGVRDPERYYVATNFTRDANGDFAGITMAEILGDILDIDYATADIDDGNGGTYQGLTRVETVERDQSNRYIWLVATTSTSLDEADAVDFGDIVLKAGDRMHLIYVRDKDDDGLAAREEFLIGTSDELADTDGDGISDYDEVVTGWRVPYLAADVYPDPTRADDYDEDGLTDPQEQAGQTDPFTPDTDGDGIYDDVDPNPNTPDGSVEGFTAYPVSNTEIQLDWTVPTDSTSFGGVIILRQTSGLITDKPVDGQAYAPGDTIGSAEVIYCGADATFTDTGLAQDSEYFYRLFQWHDFTDAGQPYVYTPGVSKSASTLYRIENVHNLAVTNVSDAAMTLTWGIPARAEYQGVIIGRMVGGTVADMDEIALTDGTPYYVGDTIANDGGKDLEIIAIISDITTDEYANSELDFHTTYGFKLFSFDGDDNYSSGAMVSQITEWGTVDIEVQIVAIRVENINEGWNGYDFIYYSNDTIAEMTQEYWVTIADSGGSTKYHDNIGSAYSVLDSASISSNTAGLDISKQYFDVARNWMIRLKAELTNEADFLPLWDATDMTAIGYSGNSVLDSGYLQNIYFIGCLNGSAYVYYKIEVIDFD